MAGSRTLKLSILADVDDLKKKLDQGSTEVEGFTGKMEKFGGVASKAFELAKIAAASYAAKLVVDGVKAALEDEAAQQRLARALEATTGATKSQIAAIETQISKTALATGVADDALRPALQRLAIATGDLNKSQQLLSLALDISKGSGKDLESVTEALAKAYGGQETALVRLGVGITAADAKTMGFREETDKLAKLFGGAALAQAETFQGQIQRLKVSFDETLESLGTGLFPVLQNVMNFILNTAIPLFIRLKDQALNPIKKAFDDNKESMRDLWTFIKDYLVPVLSVTLVGAAKVVGTAIGGIIDIVAAVINTIKGLANGVIDVINGLIGAYNRLPFKDIPTIQKIGTTDTTSKIIADSSKTISEITGSSSFGGSSGFSGSGGAGGTGGTTTVTPSQVLGGYQQLLKSSPTVMAETLMGMGIDQQRSQYIVNLNVSGALDPVQVARQIDDILKQEANSSGGFLGGVGSTRFSQQVL